MASNRTSVTTASGTTTYTYDERDRLDIVRLNGQLQADYDYDAVNRLTQTTFGNGTKETRVYDDLSRLKELSSRRLSDDALLSKYVYTLDKVGNRTAVTEVQNGQSRTIAYTYDDLYRLTGEVITDATNGNRTSGYVYDAVGNRLSKTVNGTTTTYTYDLNDRLLNEKVNNVITTSYGYDNNGSTLTKTENGVTTTYVWNDEKRLIAANVNGTQVEYGYNDQGIRVSSKVNGVETRYLLDEGAVAQVWEEYAADGQAQVAYVYGYDLISQTQANQTTFYLVDGLGSTRLLMDDQGQVLNSYGYEAFGEMTSQTGTTSNKYQFAGEQLDAVLGDYYLRQRFYDTSTGRFARADVYEGDIEDPLSIHKYVYTNSNPVIYTDPSGFIKTAELLAAFKVADILFTLAFPDPISIAMLAAPPGVPAAFAKGLGKVFGVARGALFSRMALGTARFGQVGKDSVDATRAFMTAKNIKPPFISDEYLQSLKAFLPSRTGNKVVDFVSEGRNGLVFVEAKSAITTTQLANSINTGGKMIGTRNLVETVYQRGSQNFPGIEKQIITATDVSKIPTGASAGKISKVPTSVPGEYQVFQNGVPAMPNGVPVFLQQL